MTRRSLSSVIVPMVITIGTMLLRNKMQTISKSKLKAHMLRIFREIEASGEELIVTDRDRPVLRIQPISSKMSIEEAFDEFKGQMIFYEDPDAPTIDEWADV